MSGADSRTELWLVEILAWTCLKYKLSLSAIYVWLYEPYIAQQGSHFFTLNFDFVSKQRLITEFVTCYSNLTTIEILVLSSWIPASKEFLSLRINSYFISPFICHHSKKIFMSFFTFLVKKGSHYLIIFLEKDAKLAKLSFVLKSATLWRERKSPSISTSKSFL